MAMQLQSGSLGRFWFGPQTAKGSAATTYYGYRGQLIDISPQQMIRNIGPTVGGGFLPGRSIKTGAFAAGAAVLPPAVEDKLGWLFYAFAGSVSSVDKTGYYQHNFPAGADDAAVAKYLTARRKVPGTSALYEQMIDMVPTRILIGVTPGEYTTMRLEAIGCGFSSPEGSGWSYDADDESSVPVAVKGGVEIPDDTNISGVTAVALELTNVTPPVNRVMTVGSYFPEDFPVLTRGIRATINMLWEARTFYDNFWYDGANWQSEIYNTDLDIYIQTPQNISGQSVPYELRLWAASVDWECTPPRLVPGDLVEFAIMGTLTDAVSGYDWRITLQNDTENYTWPT